MRAQLLPTISITVVSGVLNVYLFIYVYQKRKLYKSVSTYFLAYVCSIALYCFGTAFSMLATDLQELKWWTVVIYLGLPFTSPLGLLFIMRYLGIEIKKTFIAGLLVIPIITVVLVATNDFHHLYYRVFTIDPDLGAPFLYQEIGVWYLVQGLSPFLVCLYRLFCCLLSIKRYQNNIVHRFLR